MLNCSTNETFLQWDITIPHRSRPPETRFFTTEGLDRLTSLNITNVARFHFLRTSISPLISLITIENIAIGLNETRVECFYGGGVMETTIINVIENGIANTYYHCYRL